MNNFTEIKERHKTGIRGILKNYSLNNLLRGLRFPLPLALINTILIVLSVKSSFDSVKNVIDLSLSIIPNLMGFMLGGYTILISFGNTDILRNLTTITDKGPSLYQKLSAIFAFCLTIQVITLLIVTFSKNIVQLEFTFIYANYLNYTCVFIILFLLFYSISCLFDIIANVFSFSQYHHWRLLNEKMEAEKKEKIEKTKKTKTK